MKNTLALFGMAGFAAIILSSQAFAQKADEKQQKVRHIKMMKIENGKKMELDTILTGNDVFVWNGDTLGPVKPIKKFNPSGFDKMHRIDVEVKNNNGAENVKFYKHRKGKAGEPFICHIDSDDVQIFSDEEGDSVQHKIVIHKRMKDGNDEANFIHLGPGMNHFPPMPPMPPVPHMKMMNGAPSGHIIDLNDPNIISYKKKKMSGDREKIEIIRKKSDTPENMSFDFQFDDDMVAPESPEPPVLMDEFINDEPGEKMIKKDMRMEEENGKEIEEESSSEGNK